MEGEPIFRNRANQVLEYLRLRLASGQWRDRLPPERLLVQELGVSRWTLRVALKELQRDGLIGGRSQAGTEIIRAPAPHKKVRAISVGLVINRTMDLFAPRIAFLIEQLRHLLHIQGATLEVCLTPYLRSGGVSAHFKQLLQSRRHDCWVLLSPLESMQLWCAEHGFPVMVYGTAMEASRLPYAALDFRALCRHAAGTMIARGHRRLALILSEPVKSDDHLSRLGFAEGVEHSSHGKVEATYEVHDQSHEAIIRLTDRLLARRNPPTAWLICRQGSFTRFYTHLLHRGVRLPERLSILCRDWDHYFGEFMPAPTSYRLDTSRLLHRAARLVLRVALGQVHPGEAVLEMPELSPGETLGAPPEP